MVHDRQREMGTPVLIRLQEEIAPQMRLRRIGRGTRCFNFRRAS